MLSALNNIFLLPGIYTSIPHPSLKSVLTALIREGYMVRGNVFLVVDDRSKVYWSHVPSTASFKHSITEKSLIAYVEYLVDNIRIC